MAVKVTLVVTLLSTLCGGAFLAFVWIVAIRRINKFQKKLQAVSTLSAETIAEIKSFSHHRSQNEVDLLAWNVGEMLERAHLAEAAREKAQQDLMYASKMASIGEMAGGIAHEINNPLTVIGGRARQIRIMLMNDKLNKENGEPLLDSIEKTIQRIANIVRALRVHSRSNELDQMQPTNLRDIAEGTLDLCREQLSARSIRVESQFAEALPAVFCREVQIGQVILNLVKNAMDAIEALPVEERWIKVCVRRADEENCLIEVSNGGPLIPVDVREKLFRPFFTTKPVGKGTGLGLSISASILHQHNGSLTLQEVNNNTCFVLSIPIRPAGMPASENSLEAVA